MFIPVVIPLSKLNKQSSKSMPLLCVGLHSDHLYTRWCQRWFVAAPILQFPSLVSFSPIAILYFHFNGCSFSEIDNCFTRTLLILIYIMSLLPVSFKGCTRILPILIYIMSTLPVILTDYTRILLFFIYYVYITNHFERNVLCWHGQPSHFLTCWDVSTRVNQYLLSFIPFTV